MKSSIFAEHLKNVISATASFRRRPESRKGAGGMLVHTPAFAGSRRYNKTLSCHSRLLAGGNVLSKPLDSGLRRNDGFV